MGVEEKSLKSYEQNAVLIHPWRFVCIASDDNFTERVTDIAKGAGLLRAFFCVRDGERRLHVYALGCLVDHKVDFACYLGSNPVDCRIGGDHPNVHRISAAYQFVEDDVFHDMGHLVLPEGNLGVGTCHVCVCVVAFQESVEDMVERDVCTFSVFRSEPGKIGVFPGGLSFGSFLLCLHVDLFESGYLYHDTVVMAMDRFKKQDMLTFLKAANGVSTMPIFSSTG